MVWATHGESPKLLTLLVAFSILLSFGLLTWRLLVRLGLDELGSAYAVTLFQLIATNTGVMVEKYHQLDRLGLLLVGVLLGVLAYRLRSVGLFRALMTWLALFLLSYPIVIVFGRSGTSDEINVDAATDLAFSEMTEKPDILVVFLDGYASVGVLDDFYGFDNGEFLDRLEGLGFEAPGAATANYARTQLSISTVLQMDYVVGELEITEGDIDALQGILNGRSRLSEALKGQGYRHVYVESGWLGSQCGPSVDVCVGAAWPDETFYDVAYRTILRGLPGFEVGRSFTEGALHVADWLTSDLSTYLDDEQPDFIFAHVLLPHPPLFVDDHCVPDWRGFQYGFAIGRPYFHEHDDELARTDYVEQVQCVNSILVQIADLLTDDDVALIMGDHGPDGQGQLFLQGTQWNEEQRRERFGAFLATKVSDCDMKEIGSLVNVGRRMMSCLTGDDFPDLTTRIYDMHKSPNGNFVHQLELPSP
jgi:hypothetical protein